MKNTPYCLNHFIALCASPNSAPRLMAASMEAMPWARSALVVVSKYCRGGI